MCVINRRILWAVALVVLVGNAPVAFGGYGAGVSAIEKAQLPKFCWGQMEVPDAKGPEFTISGCGPGMNHYCPGLVKLIQAKKATNKGQRLSLLRSAAGDIGYTLSWMKDYPSCPIRRHVEASKVEVESLRRIYEGAAYKPPPAASTSR